MWITLPRYLSVIAKRYSQPQGFLTRPPPCPPPEGEGPSCDKLAQPELLFERCQQLIDPLLRGRLAVDPDQRFGPGEADQHPAAVLQVVLEAVVVARTRHSRARELGGRLLLDPAVDLGAACCVLLPLQMQVMARIEVRPD